MRNTLKKRILSAILSLALVLPAVPANALAATKQEAYDPNTLLAFSQDVHNMIQSTSVDGAVAELLSVAEEPEAFATGRLIVKSAQAVDPKNAISVVSGFRDLHVLQFASAADAYAAYLEYDALDSVVYVEPDRIYEMTPDEPAGAQDEFSLLNDDYTSWGYMSDHMNMDAYQEWLLSKVGSESDLPEITVAVVDSGVNFQHTDLKDRLLDNGYDFVNEDADPADDQGHGSHVSGIVVDGTLSNVKILPVKVLNENNSCTSLDFALGIYYAVDQGADVINASIGFLGFNYLAKEAYDYAEQHGVTTVVSAGNDSSDAENHSPACFENTITVAAAQVFQDWIDYDYTSWIDLADYSNYGAAVDVTAPGSGIWSTYYPCWGEIDTYESMSGTSMATPHVTAAAAMLLSYKTTYTPNEIELLLEQACTLELACNETEQIVPNMLSMASLIPTTPATSAVEISRDTATLCPGQTIRLAATAGIDSGIAWRSDNPSVATVENGIATAIAPGTTKIHAFYKRTQATCTVTVPPLELSLTPVTIYPNGTVILICDTNCDPAPALTWSISDSDKRVLDFMPFDGYDDLTYPVGSVSVALSATSNLAEETTVPVTASFGDVTATSLVTVTFPEMPWYDPNVFSYHIQTEAQLREMADVLNYGDINGLEGKTVYLDNDITLSEEWTQMPTFSGTFDGQGHSISNLTIRASENYTGLFGYLDAQGSVIDLTLKDADIAISDTIDYLYTGGIAGYSLGLIENCHFSGEISGCKYVGGIAGSIDDDALVVGCTSEGEVSGRHSVGGIVGNNRGTIEDCINDAAVSAPESAGGIAGHSGYYIRRCINNGSLTNAQTYVGGIAGYAAYSIEDCINYGTIGNLSNAKSVGGICGQGEDLMIMYCENFGEIYGTGQIGGIAGRIAVPYWSMSYINDCSNDGLITAAANSREIGGICGSGYGEMISCINTGNLAVGAASTYVGGIVGAQNARLLNCINTGSITGDRADRVGGIAGSYDSWVFENCVSTGTLAIDSGSYVALLVGECPSESEYDIPVLKNCYALGNNYSASVVREENCGVIRQSTLSTDHPKLTASVSAGDYTGSDLIEALNAFVWSDYTENMFHDSLCFWQYENGMWKRACAVSAWTSTTTLDLLTMFPLEPATVADDYTVFAACYLEDGQMSEVIIPDFCTEYGDRFYLAKMELYSTPYATLKVMVVDADSVPCQSAVTVTK